VSRKAALQTRRDEFDLSDRPDNLRFPKSSHLRRPAEFKAVYGARCKAGDGYLLIFARPNGLGETRCGLSVSKKQHGIAVRRNRIKRKLREAFRQCRCDLPEGLDLILIPRRDSGAGVNEYRQSIRRLAGRLGHKLESQTLASVGDPSGSETAT
jgi:ribonuclease P protein component